MSDHAVTVARLRAHLRAVETRYPQAWTQLDRFRAQRRALGDWPRWCYCPLAGAYAIVSGGGEARVPMDQMIDVAVVGALGAWRMTQGIYSYDPDLLDALWETPLTGDLPADLLYRLPEWCVYIETPHRGTPDADPLLGYWAHLEHDANTHRTELRVVMDHGTVLTALMIHLGDGSLEACLAAAMDEAERQADARGTLTPEVQAATAQLRRDAHARMGPLVSLVLYLCSEATDIEHARGTDARPHYPQPVQTRHGARLVAPPQPTGWQVGYRVGAALRAAQPGAEGSGGGTHAGARPEPRAHVRKAHWHTYVTGPRADVSRQRRVLRWLHPILVGAGEIVPTFHPVE